MKKYIVSGISLEICWNFNEDFIGAKIKSNINYILIVKLFVGFSDEKSE